MQTSYGKEYMPTLNNRQKWRSTAKETLKEGYLVWLFEESYKRGYYYSGGVTETIDGLTFFIRSAIVRRNDGVYKRPVVNSPLYILEEIFLRLKTGRH